MNRKSNSRAWKAGSIFLCLAAIFFTGCPMEPDEADKEPTPGPGQDVLVIQFLSPGAETAADPMRILLPKSGGEVEKPAEPIRTGYSFIGWFTNPDEGEQVTDDLFPLTVKKNTNLYARWESMRYIISFDAGNGAIDVPTDVELLYPNTKLGVTFPGSPSKEDHDFKGWFTSTAYATPFTGDTDIVNLADAGGRVTAYAKWAKHLVATFNANNGSWIDGDTVKTVNGVQDSTLTGLPSDPNRGGYVFMGWNRSQNGDGADFTIQTVLTETENFTIYAKWSKILTITFNPNGGSWSGDTIPRTVTITPPAATLTAAQIPSDPTNSDSTVGFAGWYDAQTGGNRITTSWRPTDDTEVYARWSTLTTVIFDANGGTFTGGGTTTNIPVFQGSTVTAIPSPAWAGHRITGWNTLSNGSGTEFTINTIVNSPITIYAQWVESNAAYTIFEYSATVDGVNHPDNLADGNTSTYWLTTQLPHFSQLDIALTDNDPAGLYGFRHWATLDLGEVKTGLTKIRYHDRNGSSTGDVSACEIFASEEVPLRNNVTRLVTLGKAQKVGSASGWTTGSTVGWREITFTTPVNARFIQFKGLAYNGTINAMAIGELEVYADTVKVEAIHCSADSGNQGQTGMYPALAIDGSTTTTFLTAQLSPSSGDYITAANATAAKAILAPHLPPDWHFDIGHWVTIDLGTAVSTIQGITISRGSGGNRARINDVDIYVSPNPIYGMGTAAQNAGMEFMGSFSQHPVNNNLWTISFTPAQPVRYLHIRVTSAYFGSENYGVDFGFASAPEIGVLK
jgi:uncharacterized repeat protein (TIGR02543 family)